jgi:hypothetical protein
MTKGVMILTLSSGSLPLTASIFQLLFQHELYGSLFIHHKHISVALLLLYLDTIFVFSQLDRSFV